MNEQYSIQRLGIEEGQILKAIRLEALLRDPQSFGSNYERESSSDQVRWSEFIGVPNDRAFFILKEGSVVIALTCIVRSRQEPDEAMLIASYIRNE
jgi:hypothetical protein